jgi:hypothetical protein
MTITASCHPGMPPVTTVWVRALVGPLPFGRGSRSEQTQQRAGQSGQGAHNVTVTVDVTHDDLLWLVV